MKDYIISFSSMDAVHKLQKYLDQFSRTPKKTTNRHTELILKSVSITPTILALLFRVLTQPPHKEQWDIVAFSRCGFAPEGNFPTSIGSNIRLHSSCDLSILGETLAHRAKSLHVSESPQILEHLLTVGSPEPEIEGVFFCQAMVSASECERLVAWLHRSVHLKDLFLQLTHLQEPQMLVECLGHAIHLQQLTILDNNVRLIPQEQQPQIALSGKIVRPDGNDIVLRLLHNPENQLKKLNLHNLALADDDFRAIVELLPTSQLEHLNVRRNKIQKQGILAFAAQLPRIKCLKSAELSCNPWEENDRVCKECFAALLQGMLGNYSVDMLGMSRLHEPVGLVHFYCHMNWAGRRILASSDHVPLGLWPIILKQAWKERATPKQRCLYRTARSDAIFILLQSRPVLSLICRSPFQKNSHKGMELANDKSEQ